MHWLKLVEILLLLAGIVLVAVGVLAYGRRRKDWLALPRILFNRARDLTLKEYQWLRFGGILLFAGVVVRILNLTFYPA
ncbi:LPXTG cell wall anchor domain-containing protein [Zobellella taiwanensis]|jgi:LPXTG-motif cell wall-anchored protein|uniref:Uncharacterized protein n=1 Tax=Zobellella taiwanensis TaxID=347535 RepID=A0A2P7RDN0_9GAMM|nr:LPXTG cell wall anchor domain-containing protein [Zobellella taiwanensis]PSJ48327.1 hypothetical protein C7I36_00450 [Zobellella taiwanensis]